MLSSEWSFHWVHVISPETLKIIYATLPSNSRFIDKSDVGFNTGVYMQSYSAVRQLTRVVFAGHSGVADLLHLLLRNLS